MSLTSQGRKLMASYSDTMADMLGSVTPRSVEYEPRSNVSIDPGRQSFLLVPESEQLSPQDAARELGKIPFADRKEGEIQRFLRGSKYERSNAFEKLVDRRKIEPERKLDTATQVSRWSYNIRSLNSEDTILRTRSGTALRLKSKHKDSSLTKWKSLL